MSGLKPEEVARKAQVKPERLKSWENGERRPSISQLRKLADIYKRPLSVFFLKAPPPDEDTPSDYRRFDPQATEPLSPELRLSIRDARARRDAALELYDELDEKPPEFLHAADLSRDPEEVGSQLLSALKEVASPPIGDPRLFFNYWRRAAESLGVLVFQAEGVDVEEMRGFSIANRPLPAVVVNIKDAYAARSFSLLHEITHIMLNRGGLCLFEEGGPSSTAQRTEVFCNHVAGAALLPANSLLREKETPSKRVQHISDHAISLLAKRFGASQEAVLRRLLILERVTPEFYRGKRKSYQQQYKKLRASRQAGGFAPPHTLAIARSGQLFARLVLEAYDEERITASDLSEHLKVRLKHLDLIRSAIHQKPVAGEHT